MKKTIELQFVRMSFLLKEVTLQKTIEFDSEVATKNNKAKDVAEILADNSDLRLLEEILFTLLFPNKVVRRIMRLFAKQITCKSLQNLIQILAQKNESTFSTSIVLVRGTKVPNQLNQQENV